MSKQVIIVFMLLLVVLAGGFLSGCTTAHSRMQNKRLEELERRVAKIEFDSDGLSASDDDFSKYRTMARTAR